MEEVWRQAPGEFPLACGLWSFCSIQAFSWLDETHSHFGGQSAYSAFTNLNVNFVQKHPPTWHIKLTIRPCHLVLIMLALNYLFSLLSLCSNHSGFLGVLLNRDGAFLHLSPSLCSQRVLRGMLSSQILACLSFSLPRCLYSNDTSSGRPSLLYFFTHTINPLTLVILWFITLFYIHGSHLTLYHAFIYSFCVSSSRRKLHGHKGLPLFWSLLYPQCLNQCLAHWRQPTNIYWINECVENILIANIY